MKERIVIFADTHYHLLLAISIISEYFNDSDKYEVIVIKSNNGIVDKNIVNSDGNYKIEHVNLQVENRRMLSETRAFINDIMALPVKQFLFFNEDYLLPVYMAITYKKRGTTIGLIQDGLKAYAIITKSALKYRAFRTLNFYKFLKANDLKLNSFYFFNIKYGTSKVVDELWLTHPESAILNSKPIHKINFLSNNSYVSAAVSSFSFNDKSMPADNVIFLISSLVKDSLDVLGVEKKIIADLQAKFPTAQVYIKVHPRTPKNILRLLGELKNTTIINNPAPAELYISQLNKAIILGSFSTALLYNNNASSFYWVYPMYQKHLPLFKYTKLVNPTSHIKVVDSVENITF
jgi:hypothetical protein